MFRRQIIKTAASLRKILHLNIKQRTVNKLLCFADL